MRGEKRQSLSANATCPLAARFPSGSFANSAQQRDAPCIEVVLTEAHSTGLGVTCGRGARDGHRHPRPVVLVASPGPSIPASAKRLWSGRTTARSRSIGCAYALPLAVSALLNPLLARRKLRDKDGKRSHKAVEQVDCWVFFSSLQSAHIRAIYPCIEGQMLLREAAPDPYPSQIPGYQCASFHASRHAGRWLLNHYIPRIVVVYSPGQHRRQRWDVRDQDTETSDETPHGIEPLLDLGIEDASPHGKPGRALSIA